MALLNENERRLLLLRYPGLIEEGHVRDFAALFAQGKRLSALIRLIEYARIRANSDERLILEKLSHLHMRHLRLSDSLRARQNTEKLRKQILSRRANLLMQLHSTLGKLSFKTVAHIADLPFGTVTSIIHRARCKIERALQRKPESADVAGTRIA